MKKKDKSSHKVWRDNEIEIENKRDIKSTRNKVRDREIEDLETLDEIESNEVKIRKFKKR